MISILHRNLGELKLLQASDGVIVNGVSVRKNYFAFYSSDNIILSSSTKLMMYRYLIVGCGVVDARGRLVDRQSRSLIDRYCLFSDGMLMVIDIVLGVFVAIGVVGLLWSVVGAVVMALVPLFVVSAGAAILATCLFSRGWSA